jgi:hypothetical protein
MPPPPVWSFRIGVFERSLSSPTSSSELLVADGGADELVGVVTSIGSPGEGADIWIVGGVRNGIVRLLTGSSKPADMVSRSALSVAAAICTTCIGS